TMGTLLSVGSPGSREAATEAARVSRPRKPTHHPASEGHAMPLSEDEQRILREIEDNLSATDPKLVQQVSDTTLFRHAAGVIKLATFGFVVGLVLLLATFTNVLALAVVGFFLMLGCLLVIERNVRKLGRAGLEQLSASGGIIGGRLRAAGKRFRDRFP